MELENALIGRIGRSKDGKDLLYKTILNLLFYIISDNKRRKKSLFKKRAVSRGITKKSLLNAIRKDYEDGKKSTRMFGDLRSSPS